MSSAVPLCRDVNGRLLAAEFGENRVTLVHYTLDGMRSYAVVLSKRELLILVDNLVTVLRKVMIDETRDC